MYEFAWKVSLTTLIRDKLSAQQAKVRLHKPQFVYKARLASYLDRPLCTVCSIGECGDHVCCQESLYLHREIWRTRRQQLGPQKNSPACDWSILFVRLRVLFLKGYGFPSIAPTTCGNGDFSANKRMFRVSSSSVSGNFINWGALLAIALQKSAFKSIVVHLPIPNCRPVNLYVSPVANRHNATATRLFTGMQSRNLVSFFSKSK